MDELEDEGVVLRPVALADTDNVLKWRNSVEVKKYFIYQKEITREEHVSWLEEKVKEGEVVQYIIHIKDENKDVGSVYLQNIDRKNRKCEFGIFIGEDCARGKGIGRISAQLITDYAFRFLKMNKIYLRVLSNNERAYHSYLKAGFVKEGIFKEDVWINGEPVDVIFMAKFAK